MEENRRVLPRVTDSTTDSSSTSCVVDLPNEIWVECFSWLSDDDESVASAALVCRRWRQLLFSPAGESARLARATDDARAWLHSLPKYPDSEFQQSLLPPVSESELCAVERALSARGVVLVGPNKRLPTFLRALYLNVGGQTTGEQDFSCYPRALFWWLHVFCGIKPNGELPEGVTETDSPTGEEVERFVGVVDEWLKLREDLVENPPKDFDKLGVVFAVANHNNIGRDSACLVWSKGRYFEYWASDEEVDFGNSNGFKQKMLQMQLESIHELFDV